MLKLTTLICIWKAEKRDYPEEEEPGKYNLNEIIDLRDWFTINRWFEAYLSSFIDDKLSTSKS